MSRGWVSRSCSRISRPKMSLGQVQLAAAAADSAFAARLEKARHDLAGIDCKAPNARLHVHFFERVVLPSLRADDRPAAAG